MQRGTKHHPVELDSAIEFAAEVFHFVDERLPLLTSADDYFTRQVGAGALGRCCGLLDAIVITTRSNRGDVVPILTRSLLESFAVGIICVHDDEEYVERLKVSFTKKAETFKGRNGLKPRSPKQGPGYEIDQGLNRAAELLERSGGQASSVKKMYDTMYRSDSTFEAHGLGLAMPYIIESGPPFRLESRPGTSAPRLRMPAVLTGWLAHEVFTIFGVGTSDLDYLIDIYST